MVRINKSPLTPLRNLKLKKAINSQKDKSDL